METAQHSTTSYRLAVQPNYKENHSKKKNQSYFNQWKANKQPSGGARKMPQGYQRQWSPSSIQVVQDENHSLHPKTDNNTNI